MISRRRFLEIMAAGSAGFCTAGLLSSCNSVMAEKTVTTLKEARYYTVAGNNAVKCTLCPWGCLVSEGGKGRCGVRKNLGGKMYSLVYGKAAAIHADPIEKKPLFHYLPGSRTFSLATVGCNLHCLFCQNWEIAHGDPETAAAYQASPRRLADLAKRENAPVIAYTYTEPAVFYEYMYDTATAGRKEGLKNIMVSAGFINPEPLKKLCAVLDAVKIDLKSFSEDFYSKLVNGRLKDVLETLITIKKSGIWLEIVNLVIPGSNDSPDEIKRMSQWIKENLGEETPLHFSRFIPMYKLVNVPATPVKTLERCRQTALGQGLKFVYIGNVPGHTAGSTYCPKCKKAVVKRFGTKLNEINIKDNRCRFCGAHIQGVWA